MPHRAYIVRAQVNDPHLQFIWDEWNVEDTYTAARPAEVSRLEQLSKPANCAFTIAIAEWIIARFDGFDNDRDPDDFLEASWAAVIDLCYAYEIPIVDSEWSGPVRGPISMALTFVQDAIFAEEAGAQSSMNPAWAATFARHVLVDISEFDCWFQTCLQRLEQHYPYEAQDDDAWFEDEMTWGLPVPAELFDPGLPFDPIQIGSLLSQFLAGLDAVRNEFLALPREMKDLGYSGTPYQYP